MAKGRRRALTGGAGVLLAIVYLVTRYWLATAPPLAETSYDEALTGLMGLAILRGEPQVFYWGQPYLGAIESYVAAAGFWIAGVSTLTLRMAEIAAACAWVWAVWNITGRIAGEAWGLAAGLAVALPPVFLSFAQLSAHGQSLSVMLGTLVLAAAAALLDPRVGPRGRAGAWVLLGLSAGLGWWASQMIVMFLAAAVLTLVVARPRELLAAGPYVALGLFVAASLPFWAWNMRHEWATFRHLLTWGEAPPPEWSTRLERVEGTLLRTLQGGFWEGQDVRLPPRVAQLGGLAIATFYGPGVLVAVAQVARWAMRAVRRERPWQEPLDLVVLALWLTVAAHAATWFGTSGVLRYTMTFYATLPVLGTVALARLARRGKPLAMATLAAVLVMLGYQGTTHVLFVRQAGAEPWRPVDAALETLTRLGVKACYADSRIAQVITFESRERIVCADYYGLRNFAFLQAVDAVDDSNAVAIVTHRRLEGPPPPVMAAALRRVGAEAQVGRVGEYVIFHQMRPLEARLRPIPATGWRATASARPEDAKLAFDRKVWTRWAVPDPRGAWLQLDLGDAHPVAGLTLLVAPLPKEAPGGLRVETSLDGRGWDLANEDRDLLSGAHWWKGHPRLDEGGRVVIRMIPHRARYIRLVHLDAEPQAHRWSVAELFVHEVADTAWVPPVTAVAALDEARQLLAHWTDDPGGPNPRRAPVTYAHRRAQVPWANLFAAANQAIDAAPEWEDAHELYGAALALSDWSPNADLMVNRARADRAWTEVVRWSEVADAQDPNLWRSGRLLARADALDGLGRPGEAAVIRAGVAGRPPPTLRIGFGDDVELLTAEVPPTARPAEPVPVRWVWRALRSMRDDYAGFLHLDQGVVPARFSHTQRLGHAFPTSSWTPGERIEQRFVLTIPADARPGPYRVRVAVGLEDAKEHLRVHDPDHPDAGRHFTAPIAILTVVPWDAPPVGFRRALGWRE